VWLASPRVPLDPRYGYFADAPAVHRAIDRERPDVLEASSVWSGGLAAARYRGPGARVLVFHQDPVAVYPHTLLDWALSPARIDALCAPYWLALSRLAGCFDRTVTASAWLATRLAGKGVPRVSAVDFGCARDPFATSAPDPALRSALIAATSTPRHGKLLVCVSRFHPEKRLHTVFDAFARVRTQQPVGLVVYGDGPLAPLVERWARRTEGVFLAGYTRDRAELASVLASADALLHGSAAETFGIAVAEALWAGLPVVVPDRGGAHQLAEPSAAEVYATGNAASCAAAITRMLARDRAALGAAARVHARAHIADLDVHFEALFAYYADIAR
jgi:alpha-1,6-mannosyltransferase